MTFLPNYDKKKLIILRAVLIAVGGAVGGLAVWQYFIYFPDVTRLEFRIIITVVSAAVLAGILGLSAKPFYRLGATIADMWASMYAKLGGRGLIAVFSGLIVAGLFVFLCDVVIRGSQWIWAVRLLIDILVYFAAAAVGCYAFTKWLFTTESSEGVLPAKKVGYLLAAECLTDERALTVSDALVNVNVCEAAYKALLLYGGDRDAAERLDMMIRSKAVGVVRCRQSFSSSEEYAEVERTLAANKRLRLITMQPSGEGDERSVGIACFALPAEGVAERMRSIAQQSTDKPSAVAVSGYSEPDNGSIIIDK